MNVPDLEIVNRLKELDGRRAAALVGVSTLTIAAGLSIVTAFGVYALGWQNGFTGAITKVLPLPAALVDGKALMYQGYYQELQRAQGSVGRQGLSQDAKEELNKQAFGRLISQRIIDRYAAANDIEVTSKEVTAKTEAIFAAQSGDARAIDKLVNDQFGVDRRGFERILKQQLLMEKVEAALLADEQAQASSLKRVSDFKKSLAAGEGFTAQSQAPRAANLPTAPGDDSMTGMSLASALPPEVSAKAKALKDGEVTAEPVVVDGVHYFVKRVKAVDEDVQVQVVSFQPVGLSEWLSTEQVKANITKLLPQTR